MASPWQRHLLAGALILGSLTPVQAGEKPDITITGTIALPDHLVSTVGQDDRLVIRMYHPHEGIEKDLKYWILDKFAFPQDFRIAPTVNMAGNARWPSYIIEVFTDTDRNVQNLIADELFARTPELVPLGSEGVKLVLDAPGS